MAVNTASISEVTWQMLSDAGIDIEKAERRPDGMGGWMIDYADPENGIRVVFGPSADVENNAPADGYFGWDIQCYDLIDQFWNETVCEHTATAEAALSFAAEYITQGQRVDAPRPAPL